MFYTLKISRNVKHSLGHFFTDTFACHPAFILFELLDKMLPWTSCYLLSSLCWWQRDIKYVRGQIRRLDLIPIGYSYAVYSSRATPPSPTLSFCILALLQLSHHQTQRCCFGCWERLMFGKLLKPGFTKRIKGFLTFFFPPLLHSVCCAPRPSHPSDCAINHWPADFSRETCHAKLGALTVMGVSLA